MAESYATAIQYVNATGDDSTPTERVEQLLEELSAELRAECGLKGGYRQELKGDAAILARHIVLTAAANALARPVLDGFDGDLTGVSQASFTANGTTQSATFSTAIGTARFDYASVRRLKRLVGGSQKASMVYPYGWG